MSNPLAIAAVTSTLRHMLVTGLAGDQDLADTVFTTLPLDKARTGATNQLNLFLYQTSTNGAWRNEPMPHVKQGERGNPPLSLDLHYLLTAYGRTDNDVFAHHVLGRAMSVYHDRPVLDRTELEAAVVDSDLGLQPERVRITPESLSVDEMSKLWNTFQTNYRISAAYRVSVVLIESAIAARTPLPVLERGTVAEGEPTPPFPALREILTPNVEQRARLGDTLTLRGRHLGGDAVRVRFDHRLLDAPLELDPASAAAAEVTVVLPDDAAAHTTWPAGLFSVSVAMTTGGRTQTTSGLPLALAPRIVTVAPDPAARSPQGEVTLTVDAQPDVRPGQRVSLLLGEREIRAEPLAGQGPTSVFVVPRAEPGPHRVRLRVDGADSLVVDSTATPPAFDPTQRVTIT
jgi:hypothetical protein